MAAKDRTRKHYPSPARTRRKNNPAAVAKVLGMVFTAVFAPRKMFTGLQPKRWLGPRVTVWARGDDRRLTRAGHKRY
jgi:hypothetical protein